MGQADKYKHRVRKPGVLGAKKEKGMVMVVWIRFKEGLRQPG